MVALWFLLVFFIVGLFYGSFDIGGNHTYDWGFGFYLCKFSNDLDERCLFAVDYYTKGGISVDLMWCHIKTI